MSCAFFDVDALLDQMDLHTVRMPVRTTAPRLQEPRILFYIQNKNRLGDSGLLKRFGASGKRETLHRYDAIKFGELKNDNLNPE